MVRIVLAPWQDLHNNCTSSGPRFRYDDKRGVHIRGQVDSVVACGHGRLGKASCGEREGTQRGEQHLGVLYWWEARLQDLRLVAGKREPKGLFKQYSHEANLVVRPNWTSCADHNSLIE
jgi:hypothetical protein